MTSSSPLSSPQGIEPKEKGRTLIMIDQHAASERIRVESFLSTLCNAIISHKSIDVFTFPENDSSSHVLVSSEEAREIKLRINEFEKWGMTISLKEDESEERGDYEQIQLLTVPLVVADRLKSDPRLVQELIRSFLAKLREFNSRRTQVPLITKVIERDVSNESNVANEKGNEWLKVLTDIPPVLLDLINSKACRGAIMFNDSTSRPSLVLFFVTISLN